MEIYEAAHRIRPLLSEGKTIYLLTNLPIDLLPPDEMYFVDELTNLNDPEFQEFEQKLVDFADEYGGIWLDLANGFADVPIRKLQSWFDLVCEQNSFKNKEVVAIDDSVRITVYSKNGIDPKRVKIAYFLANSDIAGLRNELGLTQKEFAEKVGYSEIYIKTIETGKREITESFIQKVLYTFCKNADR